jgi:hypothetical protein
LPAKSGVRALKTKVAPKTNLIGKHRKFETSLYLNLSNESKLGEVTFSRTAGTWVQHFRGAQPNLRFFQQLSDNTDAKLASL